MRNLVLTLLLAALCPLSGASPKGKYLVQPQGFPAGRPFSPGILADGTLYVAGQVGSDLQTGKRPEEFEAEVRTALDNIGLILREAKMDYSDVVSVQVYLTDMELFPRMNAVYTTVFNKQPLPVRTTVGVAKLVGPARIEITVTAHK